MVDKSELKVGFVTILAVLIFAYAVFSIKDISLQKRTFGYITVRYDNVHGLSTSSIVYLQGVKVGKVVSVRHTEHNEIHVRLQIAGEFGHDRIRADSAYTILAVSAISNEKYIDITPPPDKNAPFLDLFQEPEIVVAGTSSPGISELMTTAQHILRTVEDEGILAIIGDRKTQASATELISYLTSSGKNLSKITLRFNTILQNQEKSLEEFFENSRALSKKLTEVANRMEKDFDTQSVKSILDNIRDLSGNIQKITDRENQEKVDDILARARSISTRLDDLLVDLAQDKSFTEDVKHAVQTFKESAQNARDISEKIKGYLADENFDRNLRESVETARGMAKAVDNLYEGIKKTEVQMSYFLKHNSVTDNIQSDLGIRIDTQGQFLYYLGAENIGDEPEFNLFIEERDRVLRKRGGIFSSKVGVGFRHHGHDRLTWGFDLYDTARTRVRFDGSFRLSQGLAVQFRATDFTNDTRRLTESGVLYRF